MPNIKQFHPSARINPLGVGVDTVPLTLSGSDLDLTDPAGPTGGYCARALLIGSTAGNVKFDTMTGETRTQAVAANQRLEQAVAKVYSSANGTTAATVSAVL